jgi:hypothetical protein
VLSPLKFGAGFLSYILHAVLGDRFRAPKGLYDSAQGFNPGNHRVRGFALKGREITMRLMAGIGLDKIYVTHDRACDLEPLQGSSQGRHGSQG